MRAEHRLPQIASPIQIRICQVVLCNDVALRGTTRFFYVFIVYLTTLFLLLRLYSVEWKVIREWWTGKDLEECGRGLILRYCLGICLEGLRKATKNLSKDTLSPGRDLNPELPEYEAGVLTTRQRRSVHGLYVCSSMDLLMPRQKVSRACSAHERSKYIQ
jgi:hypothetical protein